MFNQCPATMPISGVKLYNPVSPNSSGIANDGASGAFLNGFLTGPIQEVIRLQDRQECQRISAEESFQPG